MKKAGRAEKSKWKKVARAKPGGVKAAKASYKGTSSKLLNKVKNWF